jgi:hypothetical protein
MNGTVNASVTTVADDSPNSNTLTDTGGGDLTYADTSAVFARDSEVNLVTEFYDGNNRHLIAATPTNIYNATASPAATSLAGSFTNGRWDTAMMNGVMGFVNGADAPQTYNGSTVGAMTVSGSGLTVTNLVGINIFKNRSFFWETDQDRFWYSAIDTLGGTLTSFPLGEVAHDGGALLRMASWTVDGGSGPDDYAVFIMDTGEIIVYQGDDPGTSTAWALVGRYKVGNIASDRAYAKLGGQLSLINESDVITVPEAFVAAEPPPTKLTGAIRDAVANYSGNDGWEIFLYDNAGLLLINIPVQLSPDLFEQYVLNLQTGGACRFTNINARTWGYYNRGIYFGGNDGVVYKFDDSYSDAGDDIPVTIEQAWTNFGVPQQKQVTTVRPTFEANAAVPVGTGIGFDYTPKEGVAQPSSSVSTGTPWGSPWGSSWGESNPGIFREWKLATGRGSTISLQTKFARQGDKPKLLNTDVLVKVGGNL